MLKATKTSPKTITSNQEIEINKPKNDFSRQFSRVANNNLSLDLFNTGTTTNDEVPHTVADKIRGYLSEQDMARLAQTNKNNRDYVCSHNAFINLMSQINPCMKSIQEIYYCEYSGSIFCSPSDKEIIKNYIHGYTQLNDVDRNRKGVINPLILAIENARDNNVNKRVSFLLEENTSLVKYFTVSDYERLEKRFNHLCSDIETMQLYTSSARSSPILREKIGRLRDFLATVGELSNHDRSHFDKVMEERMNKKGLPLLQYN